MNKHKLWKDVLVLTAALSLVAVVYFCMLVRVRIAANEGKAIATLHALYLEQARFQKAALVDQDEDGIGEYGLINELAGIVPGRGAKGGQKDLAVAGWHARNTRTPRLVVVPPAIFAVAAGYYVQVFLPHHCTVITDIGTAQHGSAHGASVDAQEKNWLAYAWPIEWRSSGVRCFAVNSCGDIPAAANTTADQKALYTGTIRTPCYYAAMPKVDKNAIDTLHWAAVGGWYGIDGHVYPKRPCPGGSWRGVDGQKWVEG